MADGITFQTTAATPPAGTVAATDDCGAAGHAQIIKLAVSADGSATPIGADANGLDVDVVRTPKGTTAFTDPTCDTTADLLLAANASRKVAIIQNAGSVDCYIGPSGVTTSSGLKLVAGASFVDDLSTSAWYGITTSGTADIRVCEVA